jgi:hypothetical protein
MAGPWPEETCLEGAEWREDKKCLGGLMPEGRAQSRRDGPIVAWHEVPGTAYSKRAFP